MKTEKVVRSEDGSEISYAVIGRGPTMVLCSGIGCDLYAWKYLIANFAKDFQIITWNYRGHGTTPAPSNPQHVTMRHSRQDLEAIFHQEKLNDAILIGHSMGVQVILDYYLHHPEQVAALVALCGSYGRPLSTFHNSDAAERILPYFRSVLERYPKASRTLWQLLVKNELTYQIAIRTECNGQFIKREDFRPYFDHLGAVDPLLFFSMLNDLNEQNLERRLSEILVPTLIVAGERDTFTPAWISRKMHDKIAQSQLLLVAGGTHTAPIEFPELINLRLEKFLRELGTIKTAPRAVHA